MEKKKDLLCYCCFSLIQREKKTCSAVKMNGIFLTDRSGDCWFQLSVAYSSPPHSISFHIHAVTIHLH